MNHRIARASVCVTLAAALILAGCSTSWINAALADLPVITQVALNIASLVAAAQNGDPNGASGANSAATAEVQTIANQVKSDLTLVQSLISSYQNATAAQKPALVQKISAALADVQTNLNAILSVVHVKDAALQATIAAAVGVAATTIASIVSLLPQPAPGHASAKRAASPKSRAAVKPPSASQLKKQFNAIFASNGFPQAELK